MIKVLSYLRTHSVSLFFVLILLVIQATTDLSLPDYMSDVVNTGVMSGNSSVIYEIGGKMLLITLVGAISSVLIGYNAARIGADVAKELRRDVFHKIQYFSNGEFDKFTTSSLITRSTNDIIQIQTFLIMSIRLVLYAPILGIGGIVKALENSPSMSWIIAVSVIVLLGAILLIITAALPKFRMVQKLLDRLNLVARETLDGMLVVRAFNTQEFEEERFDKASKDLLSVNLFVNRSMAALMPLMMLVMNLTTVAIVWVGAKQVSSFQIDIGTMMAYMQYALQIIMAFLMLAMMFVLIPRSVISANRIEEVLVEAEYIADPKSPEVFDEDFEPVVAFHQVEFKYPEGDGNVLHGIDFVAYPGQTTAIIGATGSGKSTLVNLIMRFYDVTEGSISIHNKDIRCITKKILRDKIGYVPQKSLLFSGTIESNLKYANKEATSEMLDEAAAIAQAKEFIQTKEEGYQSEIAQGGNNVSGGQKQRLSIARALVKNAPIYIFDDSFSALDLKTDRKLRKALEKNTKTSTIFIVAQRISSIRHADQILVLDNGYLVGIGTHEELMYGCEVYREIAKSQLSEEELAI
ncbi:ATP-binding cassette, subfamily B [Dethiosulfatibacter aminovorans DSM 17477]|uniref:ATP-binding cassette, subfamily B n=1 Tax=Dethiosulfatibacter aminovorans DSM 17477 TaxID=1121476 RepID=A0A1M6GAK3_9FIRM|nr:ABC transporter ATP-binding protein [Dethiosulfatibacter aminovorans]SHJ06944.1 ATP-binding cassette, subfamily B [Dethiosulfatibacter aminovorans DSM 17477]